MKLKNKLILLGILTGVISCLGISNSKAAEITSVFSGETITRETVANVSIINELDNSIVPITLGISKSEYKTNNGNVYWTIKDSNGEYKDLYCLNLARGFGNPDGDITNANSTKSYTNQYNLNSINESDFQKYTGLESNKNKILWILNNSVTSTEDLKTLLTAASKKADGNSVGIGTITSFIKEDMISNNIPSTKLTFEDIKMIQQVAIWQYTNPEELTTIEKENVFYNTISSICNSEGRQISSQGENIEVYTTNHYGYVRSGLIKQAKINAVYKYFIDGAESATSGTKTPTLSLSNTNAKVVELGDNYIVGPFSLSGTNKELIKNITANVNVDYTLLNSSKVAVANNDFSKVVGSNFYLKIAKSKITQSTDITINLTYKYDQKELTLLTDTTDVTNTQAVALVESEEKSASVATKATIELINITVEKIWNDNENQDGKRPQNITVNLLANGTKVKDITLTSSNGWKYTFEKLLKNKDGKTIAYSVTENVVSNYTTSITGDEDNGFVITNTHIPEIIEISGTKTWEDNENQDGKRPNEITVNLLANGTEIKDVKVTAANDWKYNFTDLPKYEAGEEITYNITEDKVEEYTTTVSGYNITNKYTPIKVSKTVIKEWSDGNDSDNIRPDKITVELYKLVNGQEITIETRELYESNNWTHTWNDLDEKANGEKIIYGIKEIGNIDGYTTSYSPANNYANTEIITITNTHVSKDLAIQIQKVDEQGNIITSSEVEFEISGAQTLTAETNQGKLDLNSQKLRNNFEYIYAIKETKAPIGYNGISEELSVKISGTAKSENGSYVIDNLNLTDKDGNQLDVSKISAEYNSDLNKVIIKIVNTKVSNEYKVKLLKVGEDGTTALDGSVFIVNNGQAIPVPLNGIEIASGVLSSERLNNNEIELEYVLKEETAPNGYIKIAEPKTVKIKAEVELVNNTYEITEVNVIDELDEIDVSEDGNVITIKVKNEPIITGKYNVVLRKVDERGNILKGSKFEIKGTEYDLVNGEAKLFEEDIDLYSTDDIMLSYNIKETKVPTGYIGIEDTLVQITAKVEKDGNRYKLTEVTGTFEGEENSNITVSKEGNIIVITVKNTQIEQEFDLALRKFITKINDETYSREPVVDTSTIATTGTATYKHSKQPIAVQKGDVVTYTIRVYNEGKIAGYVDKITDYLPDHLLPILSTIDEIDPKKYENEIKFNEMWLWLFEGNTVTTTITSKLNTETYAILTGLENVTDTKLEAYVEGSNKLDYIDVQIKCLVTDSAVGGEYLTNIAEIIDSQDINGVKGDGFDSELNNVDHSNLSDYKNNEAINSTTEAYVLGQEDDDDFEKLVVKEFDLALRKFITKVNETTHSREPKVDTSKLGTIVNGKTITTATYVHTKEPVIVETSDLVTYKIRIYNEGTIAGFANEITDDIPEGLEFLPNSDINVSYRWKMLDKDGKETKDVTKAVMIITDYLSDSIIREVNEVEGIKTLDYKDVEVQFKVIAKAEKLQDNLIINEAQISADSDRDIDSVPNRDEKYDYTAGKNEDDIDYEPIKLQYFDLALRKFITKVNSTDYNNRYPEIKFNDDGSITYNHTKDPVLVRNGDTVIYTIRVYNEGEKPGFATEIKDNLPEGLAFDPNNETNKTYGWKMLDKDGKETQEAEKVVAFKTNYLENEKIEALVEENGLKVLDYKDVQIAFVVTESNKSDRILVNTAQISADSDDDIDSIPDNSIESEDDIDKEYVKVQYFDLALKKWVTATKVTLDGKTTTTKTGFTEDKEGIAKVDIVANKLKKTTVKFVYNIKVTNEGKLPGYAHEVKDYIPDGLKFVAEDNKNWKEVKNNVVVTDQLKDTLLNPGESAIVEIVLTWKNSSTNLGLKTNYAEISNDSEEDIDSIPDNYDFTEDDIDDAQVILSIKTAGKTTYIGLILISIAILAGGILLIKKYVLD